MAMWGRVVCLLVLWQGLALSRGNTRDLLDDMLTDGEAGNVEGMIDKVGDMLGELVDSLDSINSPCSFKCPNGIKPKARENHIKSSNGCGTFGFEIDTSTVPLMTKCCDQHDFCYDTCNSNKDKCDSDFKACLLNMCKKMEKSLEKDELEGCKATAELMFTGTTMLGCTSFKDSQKRACDCGEIDMDSDPDVLRVNSGKSTLIHGKKSVNAKPIPGTENENTENFSKTKDVPKSDTVLKATKLKAKNRHQHEDL
eukprot:XP_011437652.1 PREDICTED: group XIIA secretory phospholipase A2 isoform X2 [Crassostrea gigas]